MLAAFLEGCGFKYQRD